MYILTILLLFALPTVYSSSENHLLYNSKHLNPGINDEKIALNLSNSIKLIDKGYISNNVIEATIKDLQKSSYFNFFIPYFEFLGQFLKKSSQTHLISMCSDHIERKPNLPVEKKIHRITSNFCRGKSLETITRNFEKSKTIQSSELLFIQSNLKYFLSKHLEKSFSYFLQSISKDPSLLRQVSGLVTDYSVTHQKIPSQDVLQDIEINERITKLIQSNGFNPLLHKNVFYTEFSKLIEQGYTLINPEKVEKIDSPKLTNHFSYLKNYLELNQDHLPVSKCLSRLNDFAKSLYRVNEVDLSRKIFTYVISKNDKSIIEDSQFYFLWTYIRAEDFDGAIEFAKKYDLLSPTKALTESRIKFWLAQAEEKRNKLGQASLYYESIIKDNPLSFYGIMSSKRLVKIKPDSEQTFLYLKDSKLTHNYEIKTNDLDLEHLYSIARLKIWTKINHVTFRDLELKQLKNIFIPNFTTKNSSNKQIDIMNELHLINAQVMQASNHLAAFKYLYEAFENRQVTFKRDLLEILYPRPYFSDLKKILANDGVDPIILLSLIRQESVFNPYAKSHVGARGLMQLMPTTAQRFKRGVSSNQLTNPKLNMEIGTKYFKNLLKRYDNNLVYVLSAYNAGENRVERWKNLYWDSEASILKNIEEIPFLETRNYVKLIFRNIFFYKILDQSDVIADNHNLNQIYNVSLGFKH